MCPSGRGPQTAFSGVRGHAASWPPGLLASWPPGLLASWPLAAADVQNGSTRLERRPVCGAAGQRGALCPGPSGGRTLRGLFIVMGDGRRLYVQR
ncbi:hypothetical protein EYF80_045686 [Liparis tanakae]|uniref:Uncharacterized protein n=1 Tax=Liparis tanakae TaxID=230148 RepID=A0A4Z2FSG4_9TELE|nr:hypothetical protein EYF80_045686 [Liparis tanakae]